jgi:arylformamidase
MWLRSRFGIALLLALLCVSAKASDLSPSFKNLVYGQDPAQTMDVYAPAHAARAPIIVMVHGGAWRIGDKANRAITMNKVPHYLGRGFIFVSINYRLSRGVTSLEQAKDVAAAIGYVQRHAAEWGGDGSRMVLMGHSAGAHLAGLLSANPPQDIMPWKGTVLLDSAALDVPLLMGQSHARFYDWAFGKGEAAWQEASPYHQLRATALPMLLVCAAGRETSCPQAERFHEKAQGYNVQTNVYPVSMSHREINENLGKAVDLTNAVDRFITAVM